jgi:uncharacterized protein (DUF2267 family)
MTDDRAADFVTEIQERLQLDDHDAARETTVAVLTVLARTLPPGDRLLLGRDLPAGLRDCLADAATSPDLVGVRHGTQHAVTLGDI